MLTKVILTQANIMATCTSRRWIDYNPVSNANIMKCISGIQTTMHHLHTCMQINWPFWSWYNCGSVVPRPPVEPQHSEWPKWGCIEYTKVSIWKKIGSIDCDRWPRIYMKLARVSIIVNQYWIMTGCSERCHDTPRLQMICGLTHTLITWLSHHFGGVITEDKVPLKGFIVVLELNDIRNS